MINAEARSHGSAGDLRAAAPAFLGRAVALGAQRSGQFILRYGLVLILGWIAGMKFTAFEAAAIQPLVATSPLMRWIYDFLSVQGASNLLGIVEISVAIMIALRPLSPLICALGSTMAVVMLATTLSFLFSLPGWEPSLGGFPALSSAGGFLVKDLILLGAALWSLGEALSSVRRRQLEE